MTGKIIAIVGYALVDLVALLAENRTRKEA